MLSCQALRASRLVVDSGHAHAGLDAPAGDRLHARAHGRSAEHDVDVGSRSLHHLARARRPRTCSGMLEIRAARDEARAGDGSAVRHQGVPRSRARGRRRAGQLPAREDPRVGGEVTRRWIAACGVRSRSPRRRRPSPMVCRPVVPPLRRRRPQRTTGVRRAGEVDRGAAGRADVRRGDVPSAGARVPRRASAPTKAGAAAERDDRAQPAGARGRRRARSRARAPGGSRGPLHGIPIVVKDNYETADMPTTGGSLALAGFMTGRDAFLVQEAARRRRGDPRQDEPARARRRHHHHQLARRPDAQPVRSVAQPGRIERRHRRRRRRELRRGRHGQRHVRVDPHPGGATTTCSACAAPPGLSSRDGIVPLSHTQDIGGPLARTVTDLALMLDATVGADPADAVTPASAGHIPPSYRAIGSIGRCAQGRADRRRQGPVRTRRRTTEVAAIVRKALDAMKRPAPSSSTSRFRGSTSCCAASALINAEFKFDLIDYLSRMARTRRCTRSARFSIAATTHAALETTFRLRNARTSPDTPDVAQAHGARDRAARHGHARARARSAGRARVSDAAPQGRRSSASRSAASELSAERDHRAAGDRHARPGSPTMACRSASSCSARHGARPSCSRWRSPTSRRRTSPPAAGDARAGERPRASGADVHGQPRRRTRHVLVRSGCRLAGVGRGRRPGRSSRRCTVAARDRCSRR